MRLLIAGAVALALVLPVAVAAQATSQYGCSWNCAETMLGSYGNVANPAIDVTRYNSAPSALTVWESPHGSTPQVYVAYIDGLVNGDVVNASFWGYDDTPSASPSLRLWAHYVSGDINTYVGSPGLGSGYTDGLKAYDATHNGYWNKLSYSYTFDGVSYPTATGIVIEARLYSTPSTCSTCSTQYWIDTLEIEAPPTAVVFLPCYDYTPPVPAIPTTWGKVKSLY